MGDGQYIIDVIISSVSRGIGQYLRVAVTSCGSFMYFLSEKVSQATQQALLRARRHFLPRQGDEDIMIQAPNQDTQALPNHGKNEATDEEKIQTPHFEVKTETP